jgi:hypothetical protein
MKLTLKLFSAAALMFGGFGCSDNESAISDNNAPNVQAQTSFALSLAHSPSAVTIDESEINRVDVFIYDGQGKYLSHNVLSIADFDIVNDSLVQKTPITTTVGLKCLFLAANLPAAVSASLENKDTTALTGTAQELLSAQLINADGFAMASPIQHFLMKEESDANRISVAVSRLVAKITVQESATLEIIGSEGIAGAREFAVYNINKKTFLVQGAAPDFQDPNWTSGSYVATDFYDSSVFDAVTVISADGGTPQYMTENTSQEHRQKEITRALVRSTFIPKYIYDVKLNRVESGWQQPQTFFALLDYDVLKTAFFGEKSVAEKFCDAKGLDKNSILEYKNGYCYWDIFPNKDKWDVFRNDWYKSSITKILYPGRPESGVTDPENPPYSTKDIEINTTVLPWETTISEDDTLEGETYF